MSPPRKKLKTQAYRPYATGGTSYNFQMNFHEFLASERISEMNKLLQKAQHW